MNSHKLIHKKYHWKQVSSMVILCLLLGCGVEKYIPEGSTVYRSRTADIRSAEEKVKDLKKVKTELNSLLQPEPNSSLLGMRLGLYYHYKAQKKSRGGF